MAGGPITIKLRCASWKQLQAIYKRDLLRGALFLRSTKPPPLGTKIRVSLVLPTDSVVVVSGAVSKNVGVGELGGRGPGIDIALDAIPQSAMWLIESALANTKEPQPRSVSVPAAGAMQARRRSTAPPTNIPKRAPTNPTTTPDSEASLDSGANIVEAEAQLLQALKQELTALRKLNAFQMLDVDYNSDDAQVRTAFGKLTKRYHPDRFARYQSPEARQLASEIFILVRDAYRKVNTKATRGRTLAVIENRQSIAAAQDNQPPRAPTGGAKNTAPAVPAQRPSQPTPPAQPANRAQKPAQPASAASPPTPSLAANDLFTQTPPRIDTGPVKVDGNRKPRAGTYSREQKLIEQGKYEEALTRYNLAARKIPGDARARAGVELAEGLKVLAEGNNFEAAQHFEAVLELDPTNERAARELAEMRRQATNERKGLLARLLGKRE